MCERQKTMFHLILSTCLAAQPALCDPRLLPAGGAPSRSACELAGARIARHWLALHPDLADGGGTHCIETVFLPALSLCQIAPGIHLHLGSSGQISRQNCGRIANSALVIGDTVAVIDSGGSRAEGEALHAAIRKLTDRPIRYLILTHIHPDHILGAEVFADLEWEEIASPSP
jgi:hypothetical protein